MSMQSPLRVAVLFGGTGAEHDISCRSAASVLTHARCEELCFLAVGIDRRGAWYLYEGAVDRIACGTWREDAEHLTPTFPMRLGNECGLLSGRRLQPVDVVLPVLHGDGGEDGTVQGLLHCAGLPFVGADTRTGALCTDKAATKALCRSVGIPVTPYTVIHPHDSAQAITSRVHRAFGANPYPLFIKPTSLGSSVGAARACDEAELLSHVGTAEVYGDLLIEPCLSPLTELEVGFLDGKVAVLSEIGCIRSPSGFYDYDEKYGDGKIDVDLFFELPSSKRRLIYRYTRTVLRAVGARDLCRVDFFLTGDGRLYLNELNPFPGFERESMYPRMMARMGIDYPSLVRRLCRLAYARRA